MLSGCIAFFDEEQKVEVVKNRQNGLVVPAEMANPKKSNEYVVKDIPMTMDDSEITTSTTALVIVDG